LDPGFLASDKTSVGSAPLNEEINIASSDSEVEIVGVQEHARWASKWYPGNLIVTLFKSEKEVIKKWYSS
jgi:hypothetical protein